MLIPLTQGQFAIIDDADHELVGSGKWHAVWRPRMKTFYAQQNFRVDGVSRRRYMHRVIMGAKSYSTQIDHADHNGLNNQRSNLRLATRSQNMANARLARGVSEYRGVVFVKRVNAWRSQITVNRKVTYLGYYDTEFEAAQAYNNAAEVEFGVFAMLNDVPRGTPLRNSQKRPARWVSYYKQHNKWGAYGFYFGCKKHLGLFATEAEALAAVSKFKQEIQDDDNECPPTGGGHGCASSATELV